MAAMKPRTGDGPLEVTKEGRGIVMRVPARGWRATRRRAERRGGRRPGRRPQGRRLLAPHAAAPAGSQPRWEPAGSGLPSRKDHRAPAPARRPDRPGPADRHPGHRRPGPAAGARPAHPSRRLRRARGAARPGARGHVRGRPGGAAGRRGRPRAAPARSSTSRRTARRLGPAAARRDRRGHAGGPAPDRCRGGPPGQGVDVARDGPARPGARGRRRCARWPRRLVLASYGFTRGPTPPSGRCATSCWSWATRRACRRPWTAPSSCARAVATARDLVNTPALTKSPAWLAERAVALLPDLAVRCPGRGRARRRGASAASSASARARPGRRGWSRRATTAAASRHVVLVGKGITFDTGGLSLKPNDGMVDDEERHGRRGRGPRRPARRRRPAPAGSRHRPAGAAPRTCPAARPSGRATC